MSEIPVLHAEDKLTDVVAVLRDAGAVVLKSISDDQQRQSLANELEPFLDAARVDTEVSEDDFYPGHTRRITALIRKSEVVRDFVLHPQLVGVCDDVLKSNCESYQLHVSSALVVGPGARQQVLHREDDTYEYFDVPRPDLIVASMWAMTDFTTANGATNIVPGSHRWEAGRQAQPDEVVAAQMSAGDVLIWMGGTLHGAGANVSDEWRYGVFLSYSLGWLRQEENQYLDVPPDVALTLPSELRHLVGYKMHRGLGFHEPL